MEVRSCKGQGAQNRLVDNCIACGEMLGSMDLAKQILTEHSTVSQGPAGQGKRAIVCRKA